jgi:hypothetical protein
MMQVGFAIRIVENRLPVVVETTTSGVLFPLQNPRA